MRDRTSIGRTSLAALLVVIIALVGGLAYLMWPRAPPAPTIVTYASLSEMTTLDPSTEFSNSVKILPNVYETLVLYDPLNDRVIPALAERWEASPDGLTWTFHLRRNVKFHDGTPFNATAVKYSIERTVNLGQGAAFIWDPVESIVILDPFTVQFRLKYAAPLLMIASSAYGAYIMSPHAPNTPEWFNAGNDSGSGPYRVKKWEPKSEVVLERFDGYWGGWRTGQPDIAVIRIVPDAATQEQLVLTGQVDIAEQVPLESISRLKTDPRVKVVITPSFQNLLGLMNTKKPPLDNVLVRQAISHAVPYSQIVKVARLDLAVQARGPVPAGMFGHIDDLPQYEYNLDRAAALLTQAGYPGGGFKLVLTYTAGDVHEQKTAELLRAELAKLNIELEIRPMPWEEQWALARSDPTKAQDILVFYWWPTYITPYDFLANMFRTEAEPFFNLAYYSNAEFDRLIDEARTLEGTDRNRALQLYRRAQLILVKDAVAIFFYDQQDVKVLSARLQGFSYNPAYSTVVFFYQLTKSAAATASTVEPALPLTVLACSPGLRRQA
jgi:peptide/nickel transport system substrate-binding protein